MSLLAPCLGLGVREISGGQNSPLFEAAREATLERVSSMAQQLPAVHQVFQPFLPVEPTAYWSKLNDLFGNTKKVLFLKTAAEPVPCFAMSKHTINTALIN